MSGEEMAKANGEKIGEAIYDALLSCVQRNTADEEFVPAMMFLVHKSVWELTASNEKANQVLALIAAGEPVEADDKEIEDEPPDDATDA